MWQYVYLSIIVLIPIGIYWLFQPYFAWKQNFKRQKTESITVINMEGERLTRHEFLQRKNKLNLQLSLVVPSYNQEKRLPIMLEQTVSHLNKLKITYQIIIVNDGSKDKTTQVAISKAKSLSLSSLYVVEYPKNRGKGGAVRCGMFVATGKYILMVDADGATTFSQYDKVRDRLNELQRINNHPLIMVVGSRHHLSQQNKVERKFIRKFISGVFWFLISVVCGIKTKDTQCGFKLFTKQSAKILFETLHLERWAFDIELFLISKNKHIITEEVPVEWRDIDGSKLNIFQASISMLRDILTIRLLYILRFWKFTDKVEIN